MTTEELAQAAAERAGRRRAGVVVGVLEEDGTRTHAGAGKLVRPDENALFEIGSITKVLIWHNGGTGGFRSFAGFQPELGKGVVVLTNHARGVDLTGLNLLRAMDG